MTTGPLYSLTPSFAIVPEDEQPEGHVFANYLEFPDLVLAQHMLSLWYVSSPSPKSSLFLISRRRTRILLQTTTETNARILSSSSPSLLSSSSDSSVNIDQRTRWAFLIAQAMPYCLRPCFRTAGPILTVHPLYGAMQWFEQVGRMREHRWCEEWFSHIVARGSPFGNPGEGVVKQESGKSRKAAYQLHLPPYGRQALKLELED